MNEEPHVAYEKNIKFPGPLVITATARAPTSMLIVTGCMSLLAGFACFVALALVPRHQTPNDAIILTCVGLICLALGLFNIRAGLAPIYPRRASLTLDGEGLSIDYGGQFGRFGWTEIDSFSSQTTPRGALEFILFNSTHGGPFRARGWDYVTQGKAHLLLSVFGPGGTVAALLQAWRDRAVLFKAAQD